MIVLFTDFGADDLYVGQVKAALLQHGAAGVPIVDLLHSAPAFQVPAAAHLLAALQGRFDAGTVFLAVVDPGVGGTREAVVVHADGKWFVGPDNGLLSVLAARAGQAQCWRIVWRPPALSMSFHGRDLFAPIAARVASGGLPADRVEASIGLSAQLGAGDLAEIIYVDHYGNAMTGLRAGQLSPAICLEAGGRPVGYAPVFSAAPSGSPFWYENSIGLAEIAVNLGGAAVELGLRVGDPVRPQAPAARK